MKVLGLISEYNPFHYGHKYHLTKSLMDTRCDYSIAVMSGSFVQRGMPSFIDKWTKAKMAIDNGVDLVIELPTIYSCQSAELFALGAIKILNSISIVDYISFGSEEGDLEVLDQISKILLEEPTSFKTSLKYYLSLGNSFPVARSQALQDYLKFSNSFDNHKIKRILKQSNNILGIEYLKALQVTNSNIKPYTIQRLGADYNDKDINIKFSSATGIRNTIFKNKIESSRELLPAESFSNLEDYFLKYGVFNKLENYNDIIRYLFLTTGKNSLKNLFDMDEGLENRILKIIKENNSLTDIVNNISTKRYPSTRIQRIFIHLLLGLNNGNIEKSYKDDPNFIRILGSNKRGFEIINEIKKKSSTKIITKFSDYRKYNLREIDSCLDFEKKATDIYFLGLNLQKPLTDMDYYISPYIK